MTEIQSSAGLCDSEAHTLSTVTLLLKIYLTMPLGNRVNGKCYIFDIYSYIYINYLTLVITSKIDCGKDNYHHFTDDETDRKFNLPNTNINQPINNNSRT